MGERLSRYRFGSQIPAENDFCQYTNDYDPPIPMPIEMELFATLAKSAIRYLT